MAKKETSKSLSSLIEMYSAEKQESFVSTGILPIDKLWGGGICPGGLYAIWGPQGSGKSTIALQIVKSFCKRGEKCLWLDVEKALNVNQQEAFGVRQFVEDGTLLHLKADTYVQADEITTAVANDKELNIKLVVVDSETMLNAKLADDQRVDDNQPGVKARQASTWLTKVKGQFFDAGITMIVLFHARANISMTANPYAPATKQAGGYAALHCPDCILQVQPGQKFGDKDMPDGQVIHLQCDKNKFAKPFVKKDVKLFYGKGILKKVCIIDSAIEQGLIVQSGSFFKLPNGDTIRGTQALYDVSPDVLKDLQSKLTDN